MISKTTNGRDNLVTLPTLRTRPGGGTFRPMRCTGSSVCGPLRTSRNRFGFTLVEMLAVCAIIVIMMALVAPVVGTMTSTAGRKGAVNILMNTLEQARVAALESGRDVHVVFRRQQFPEPDMIMVARDREDGDPTKEYEQLTRWIKMPKGVLLYRGQKGRNLLSSSDTGSFNASLLPGGVPTGDLNVLTFNSFGGIRFPSEKNNLMLIVSEGVRGEGGTEAVIANKKDQVGGFEIISFRRFTGRASLEISTLPGA